MKRSFSDRTQEPRGVPENWEKDNVDRTRRTVGGLRDGIAEAESVEVLADLPATAKGTTPQRRSHGGADEMQRDRRAEMLGEHMSRLY